jgi:hypothetical protein
MNDLARCPCGAIPEALSIYDGGQGGKWHYVVGNCCGEWMIEFRASYHAIDSDACKALAAAGWNAAKRAPLADPG